MENNIMNEATDLISYQDDKKDGGMGLGNSMGLSETGSTIDLERPNYGYQHDTGQGTQDSTQEEDKSDYDPLEKEEKQTQGEYERELQTIRETTENIRDDLDILKEDYKTAKDKTEYFKTVNKYEKYLDKNKNYKDFNEIVEDIKKGLENELTTLYDREYEIMNNDEYDPRDYGETRIDKKEKEAQDREDDETNRAVEAMRKAGLNPATLSGNITYGGGGGISSGSGKSSDEEDEEKRRKRKREEEAARLRAEAEKKRQNQQMVMQIVQMLGGIGGTLGAAAIRNQGLMGMANIRGQSYLDNQNLRNMNALELENLRYDNRVSHTQIKDMYQRSNNDRKAYQRLQRDKRNRYSYWDDIDW